MTRPRYTTIARQFMAGRSVDQLAFTFAPVSHDEIEEAIRRFVRRYEARWVRGAWRWALRTEWRR